MCPTVQEVREAVNALSPFAEMVAKRTANKLDDLGVTVLRVVANNDEICQKVCEALGHEEAKK